MKCYVVITLVALVPYLAAAKILKCQFGEIFCCNPSDPDATVYGPEEMIGCLPETDDTCNYAAQSTTDSEGRQEPASSVVCICGGIFGNDEWKYDCNSHQCKKAPQCADPSPDQMNECGNLGEAGCMLGEALGFIAMLITYWWVACLVGLVLIIGLIVLCCCCCCKKQKTVVVVQQAPK